MMRTSKSMVVCSAVLCGLLVGLAFGVSNGEKAKVKGVIATRTGETLVLATDSGNVTVVLNDDTKVQQPKVWVCARSRCQSRFWSLDSGSQRKVSAMRRAGWWPSRLPSTRTICKWRKPFKLA